MHYKVGPKIYLLYVSTDYKHNIIHSAHHSYIKTVFWEKISSFMKSNKRFMTLGLSSTSLKKDTITSSLIYSA